jgi:hypothetical protein
MRVESREMMRVQEGGRKCFHIRKLDVKSAGIPLEVREGSKELIGRCGDSKFGIAVLRNLSSICS